MWIMITLFGIIASFKFFLPEDSYEIKSSLWIAAIGAFIFAYRFYSSIGDNFSLWHLVFCIICCRYIMAGGKSLALKTASGVFSKVTKKSVGLMEAGSLNWADPLFEVVTISVDGVPNISIDLQKLEITIEETALMQTSTSGIQAKVKNLSFILKLTNIDDIQRLLEIEGGVTTVRKRIIKYVGEIIMILISQLSPEDIDQDKNATIETLADEIELRVNAFCLLNDYPYSIINTVIIGDTELEQKYYEVLAKKEFTRLEQDGLDVEADRIKVRLIALGTSVLPTGTKDEQLKAAMIALKITPKTLEEKSFGVSPEVAILLKELAVLLKS